jgi:pimeloyl-ACP methyl ester carboxylesterase
MKVEEKHGTREQLLDGLPATDERLELAGIRTAVLMGGAGTPVVLLHGSGEFAAVWTPVIPELAAGYRLVVPDLPGHGASWIPDGGLDGYRVLEWLGALIAQTCPSPPAVVGHGLGGAIAARFAADQPERIGRLVLVDALGLAPFGPAPSFAQAMHQFLEQPTEETRDGMFRQCFVDLDRVRRRMGERWAPIAAYALAGATTPGQHTALEAMMPRFAMAAIPPEDLARITVPTTLIWGRQDLFAPLPAAEAASARHGWPLHVIDDCGDDPAVEQPEAFLAALREGL